VKAKKLAIPRAYQVIQQALEQAIVTGDLEPGEPLPTETELAEKFGVTRHTVREAMRVVEQSGLVQRDAGRRLHVVRPSHDALALVTSRALLMQRVTLRELWEIGTQIEMFSIDVAMSRLKPSLAEALEANVEQMEQAVKAGDKITDLDMEFHWLIAKATENRAFHVTREAIAQLFFPALEHLYFLPKTKKESPRRVLEAHKHILEAIKVEDAETARDWMAKHMADFPRSFKSAGLDIDMPSEIREVPTLAISVPEFRK
jgi:GntR family transcriptional regulator, transcriptional repressor for pyruvate dehydrogenase complex